MASLSTASEESFQDVYNVLLTFPPPLLPPGKAYDTSMTDRISSLLVHPTLEAALHLLNHDLPSAHFLVRHMQAAPQFEGMFLHGILHRIESDYDNARAWYSDVAESDVFIAVWRDAGGLDGAKDFIGKIEDFKKGERDDSTRTQLEARSIEEIKQVISFSRERYGIERMQDASQAWKQPEGGKVQEAKEQMTSKGQGHRQF